MSTWQKVAIAAAVGLGGGLLLWKWTRTLKTVSNVYETKSLVNQYMAFHYATPEEYFPYQIGPREHTDFPKRCAELCVQYKSDGVLNKALDIGCAVGRSSFELARSFDNVIGIDFSHAFIDKCNEIKHQGSCKYILPGEGELGKDKVAKVSHDIDRDRCVFMQGDACNLSPDLGQFGCVLGANMVCRLPDPMVFLNRLRSLVVPGGIVVLVSPYTWLEQYTPKDKWLGGYVDSNGEAVTGSATLRKVLEADFDLVHSEDFPFVIKETAREHQWTVSDATVWRRKP
jgi:putative 4-mercaptohistidine N1-methyltranferase